jgi:hypothetical protein
MNAIDDARTKVSPVRSQTIDVQPVAPAIASLRDKIEHSIRATNENSNPSWQEYQSTITLAGRFCAVAMQMTEVVGGEVSQTGNDEINRTADLLISNLRKALPIMKAVADQTYPKDSYSGRGHEEANARLLAAGEIAAQFAVSGKTISNGEGLQSEILGAYKYVTSKVRSQGVAEERWGALSAAAAIGTGEYLLKERR